MDETYNGWTNRATWAVALHVNNDQGWQEQVHELVQSKLDENVVPEDYEVKVLDEDDEATDLATCGTCGRSWDDAVVTSMTPVPSARCPFEYYHVDEDDVAELVKDSVTAIVDPLAYVEEFGDIMLSDWLKGPGMAARDIGDLDDVDWHELAESFIRDVREDAGYVKPAPRTAVLLKNSLPNSQGHAALYRLTPPLDGHEYVRVSAASVPGSGPETYIFAADSAGEVTDWSEMDGSYRGGMSHAEALRNAGYTITD